MENDRTPRLLTISNKDIIYYYSHPIKQNVNLVQCRKKGTLIIKLETNLDKSSSPVEVEMQIFDLSKLRKSLV